MGYQEKIRLTIAAILVVTSSFAQEAVTIKGVVADSATLRSIAFVNVVVKHSTRGTTTDANGYFAMSVHPRDTIIFSFIGYRTLELPARGWEPSVILMTEIATMLKSVTIHDTRIADPYEHLFDEENARLEKANKPLPFYYSKDKKDRILLARAKKETLRVKNYVDLIVKNDEIKSELMKKHKLSETEYYDLLTKFNEKNYAIMYYLTDSELLSLLYRFFDANAAH